MKKKTLFILLLIIFFGAFLRLYKLDKFPPSLFGDEVDVGYQAYSILKTGKDYSGNPWPISFQSLADWRTPLFLYSAVPLVAIFGLNEWGVRLPAAIFGILTLPLFFLLVKQLLKNERLALLGTFFLSVSMWHLQYSRAAFEVTQMLFLLVGGVYLFLKGLKNHRFLVFAAILLALTPYSYNTAKFFLPLLLLILLVSFWEKIKTIPLKRFFPALAVLILISVPMAKDILFGQGGNRFSILSIFSDPTIVPQIGFDRQVDMTLLVGGDKIGVTPSLSSRVFHNKYLYWGTALMQNYFKVFSTEFLFTKGDINFRHSIQGGFGELYWLDVVFLILGLFYLLKQKEKSVKTFLFVWLFLAPIPSILTRDGGNHATRLILMLPPLLIFLSFGVCLLYEIFEKRRLLLSVIFGLIFLVQFSLYLHRYFIHYPQESEEWWHFGYKEQAIYVGQNEEKYDYIVFSDRDQPPLIFSLFWLKVNPRIFQGKKLEWTEISDAIWADRLPGTKYYFGHVSEERIKANGFIGTLKPNILYLMPGAEIGKDFRYEPVPNSIKLLDTTYYSTGRVCKYAMTGT